MYIFNEELELKNRENMFNYGIYDTIFRTKERLIFEVNLNLLFLGRRETQK